MADKPVKSKKRTISIKEMNRSVKMLIALGAVVLVFIAGIYVLVFASSQGAVPAADSIIYNVQEGDCKEIYETQTSQAFREAASAEDWQTGCMRVAEVLQGKVTRTGLTTEVVADEIPRSNVAYEIDGPNGVFTVVIQMIEEDGGWKMYNFDSASGR